MKWGDAAAGVLTAILGAAIVVHTWSFPPMPGQPVGPALFPAVIGSGLVIAGLALVLTGGRRRDGFSVAAADWARRPRMVLNFALVVIALLFYALALHRLGFFITAVVFLTVLLAAFGVKRRWIPLLALAVTLLIHYGFYTLLRVPLPWGVLEGLAW